MRVLTVDERPHGTASVANPRRTRVGRDGRPLPVGHGSADEPTDA